MKLGIWIYNFMEFTDQPKESGSGRKSSDSM